MLLGFWYYMDYRCSEKEKANQLAIKNAVENAVAAVNSHKALEKPKKSYHAAPKKEKKETVVPAKKKKETMVFTDKRDGQKYKMVNIGDQTWMAENLNFKTDNSLCYDEEKTNCDNLGMLYTWNEASVACPEGWHLPNDAEWSNLINHFDGIRGAGKHLKKGGESGFDDLLAGYHDKEGFYGKKGESSYHWSSTEQNANYASFKGIYHDVDNVGVYTYTKADGFSVRCIKD